MRPCPGRGHVLVAYRSKGAQHPRALDILKTRTSHSLVSSEDSHIALTRAHTQTRYAKEGPVAVGKTLLKTEGVKGLYRGMVPILLSTGVQKSALFAGYAGARRWCDQSGIGILTAPIPGLHGMTGSVIVGSIAASTARSVVETPFELAKVRSQTGGSFRSGAGIFSLAQVISPLCSCVVLPLILLLTLYAYACVCTCT